MLGLLLAVLRFLGTCALLLGVIMLIAVGVNVVPAAIAGTVSWGRLLEYLLWPGLLLAIGFSLRRWGGRRAHIRPE